MQDKEGSHPQNNIITKLLYLTFGTIVTQDNLFKYLILSCILMGKHERKREKRNQIIMSVVLVFLMVTSIFGIMIGNSTSNLKYGDYKFKEDNNHYITKINDKEMFFYTLPSQAEYINLSSNISNKIKESYLVMISFNPNDQVSLQTIELARFDFAQFMDKPVFNGILEESVDYSLPILTCANATQQTPMIIFNVSDNFGFIEKDNCIYLNGRGMDFLRLRDRLLYSVHNVIQDE